MNADQPSVEDSATDLESIKARLSVDESQRSLREVDDAIEKISQMRSRLASTLTLKNGHLLAGSIRFAAFRVETLSLIFELAKKEFAKSANPEAYVGYLDELGELIGVTYARELIHKLVARDQIVNMKCNEDIVDLWAMFENETGAGVTERVQTQTGTMVIRLKNNPLRARESTAHAHCHFYQAYIKALLNEFFTSRPRQLQKVFPGSEFRSVKVVDVQEQPDADDYCIFSATVVEEQLKPAFDLLDRAWTSFESGSYGDSINDARSALERAQLHKVGCADDMPAKELHGIFEKKMDKRLKKVWHDVYHRLSETIHRKTTNEIDSERLRAVLLDVRRCIYALEFLQLTNEEAAAIRTQIEVARSVAELVNFIRSSSDLASTDKDQVLQEIERLRKGSLDEQNQISLVDRLKKLKAPAWDIAEKVLSSLISDALKKQLGLGG